MNICHSILTATPDCILRTHRHRGGVSLQSGTGGVSADLPVPIRGGAERLGAVERGASEKYFEDIEAENISHHAPVTGSSAGDEGEHTVAAAIGLGTQAWANGNVFY